eukprot:103938_1
MYIVVFASLLYTVYACDKYCKWVEARFDELYDDYSDYNRLVYYTGCGSTGNFQDKQFDTFMRCDGAKYRIVAFGTGSFNAGCRGFDNWIYNSGDTTDYNNGNYVQFHDPPAIREKKREKKRKEEEQKRKDEEQKKRIGQLEIQIDGLITDHKEKETEMKNTIDEMNNKRRDDIKNIAEQHSRAMQKIESKLKDEEIKRQKIETDFKRDIKDMKSEQLCALVSEKGLFLKSMMVTYNNNNYNDQYMTLYEKFKSLSAIV